jgi:manganese efflux pump family protein
VPRVVTPLSRPFRTPAAGTGAACAGAACAGAAWAAVGIAVAGAVLVAGCSRQSASSRGTVSTCYGFAVQALDRHATVTSVPPACTGLNHEQINLAVDRAIRAVVGPHRKVVARRLAHREAAYLAYLVTVVPPRAPVPPVTAPSRPSSRLPLDLAALAAWAVTVAAGARLLAGWIASGGLRRRYTRVAGVPRAVIVGHFTLALTGLGIWIGFLATGLPGLAWAGVAAVLSVAGLGMATLAGGLPQAQQAAGLGVATLASGLPQAHQAAGPGGDSQPATALGTAVPPEPAGTTPRSARTTTIEMPAGQSLAVIALHGVLAAATILLVVLAAIGAG